MIIIHLMGGLGNQLFQYAIGRRLSYKHTTSLRFDITWYQNQNLRSFQLDAFKTLGDIASPNEIKRIKRTDWRGLKARIYQAIQRRLPYYYRRVVVENDPFYFDRNIVNNVTNNVYLIGYWQNYKYMAPIDSVLREELNLSEPPSLAFQAWGEKISQQVTTSLHVRRGDYVHDLIVSQVHGACSLTYYTDAISYIRQQVPKTAIFVFSDDQAWAKEKFGDYSCLEFVELEDERRDQEELLLMRKCDHHIISNSSYSWWGAWLGHNPEKIVIAPQKWFSDSRRNTMDLIPETWIRL